MEKQRVIAVDFDGCLCDNAYPDIGAPNWQVIDAALKERADGAALILWTCREGDMLQQALDACKGWGLEFDAVNDSLPKWKETWKNDPRKIGATEYWDDKAVRMPNIDPVTAAAEALGMSPDRLRELAQADKADEIGKYRFYYCESEDEYLIGARLDTFYYARWDGSSFTWSMSRYLPWGKHVVAPETAWKEYTYPSEPKEIGMSEWFKGFLGKLTREAAEAALEEMEAEHE